MTHTSTPGPDRAQIDDVMLDMDGTLLDRHFDNFFFEEELPRRYAAKYGLEAADAREKLFAMYRKVEGELNRIAKQYRSNVVKNYVYAVNRTLDAYQFNILSIKH